MTGVAFSEHAEPQFSVELKQQIDSFMSRHKSRVKSTGPLLGQTLGSATDIALHLSSTKAPGKPAAVDVNSPGIPPLSVLACSAYSKILCVHHQMTDRFWVGAGLNECGVRY